MRGEMAKHRRRVRVLWISLGVVMLLGIAGLVTWGVYRAQRPANFAYPAASTNDGGAVAGVTAADEGGAIPVEVYQDFLCPDCKQFTEATTPTLNSLLADKKIKLVWHPMSLLDAYSSPPGYSSRTASAAGCASDAGGNKMKALGEALFQAQPAVGGPALNDDQLIDLAGRVGIITPVFAACVRDVKYKDWAKSVNDKAAKRGITQTLAVFVNGKLVASPGPQTITAAVTSGG